MNKALQMWRGRSTDQLDSMRSFLTAIVLATMGIPAHAACPERTVQERFASARAVVLAHVTESSFPSLVTRETIFTAFEGTATLTVERSWKGPFSVGAIVKVGPPRFATGVWSPRLVRVGEDVLIFATVLDPVWLDECSVFDEALAQTENAGLDYLVVAQASAAQPNR